MNWVIIGVIGLGVVWLYSKVAAAKAVQAQSPQLTVPQGSTAASILSSLGIAANLIPSLTGATGVTSTSGLTPAAAASETQAYIGAASAPGSEQLTQIASGNDVGANQQQIAQANTYAQQLNQSQGLLPDSVIIQDTSSLLPQGDDSTDMSGQQTG